jgi:hypothetical protein
VELVYNCSNKKISLGNKCNTQGFQISVCRAGDIALQHTTSCVQSPALKKKKKICSHVWWHIHTCNPSYFTGRGGRIESSNPSGAKLARLYIKNIIQQKYWRCALSGTGLA